MATNWDGVRIAEQHRIVERLEELPPEINKLKQLIQARTFKQFNCVVEKRKTNKRTPTRLNT
jgi:hypothetical protein